MSMINKSIFNYIIYVDWEFLQFSADNWIDNWLKIIAPHNVCISK